MEEAKSQRGVYPFLGQLSMAGAVELNFLAARGVINHVLHDRVGNPFLGDINYTSRAQLNRYFVSLVPDASERRAMNRSRNKDMLGVAPVPLANRERRMTTLSRSTPTTVNSPSRRRQICAEVRLLCLVACPVARRVA